MLGLLIFDFELSCPSLFKDSYSDFRISVCQIVGVFYGYAIFRQISHITTCRYFPKFVVPPILLIRLPVRLRRRYNISRNVMIQDIPTSYVTIYYPIFNCIILNISINANIKKSCLPQMQIQFHLLLT
jgi:hypothetical protein